MGFPLQALKAGLSRAFRRSKLSGRTLLGFLAVLRMEPRGELARATVVIHLLSIYLFRQTRRLSVIAECASSAFLLDPILMFPDVFVVNCTNVNLCLIECRL
jgi:hypothetical protein